MSILSIYKFAFIFSLLFLFNFLTPKVYAGCGGGSIRVGNPARICSPSGCSEAKGTCTSCYWACSSLPLEYCSDQGGCSSCVNIQASGNCGGARCNWNSSYSCSNPCYGGYDCWGNALGAVGHGGTVCGGGHINYLCSNGTFYNQGTACYSCSYSGTCGGSVNSCASGVFQDVGDSGTQYLWNCLGNGWYGGASCAINIPVTGVCGGTLNTCNAGTFSDVADSGTQYLWSCLGYYGGGNASCAINIPSATPTPTPTPTATPTPTPNIPPYFKMKDTSFYKIGNLSSNFPASYGAGSQYDSSDNYAGGYFNQGQAGVVMTSGGSLSAGVGGTAYSGSSGSPRNWTATSYSGGNTFVPSSFLNYVIAKKSTTSTNYAGLPQSGTGGTYSISDTNVTVGAAPFRSYITIIMPTAASALTLNAADLGKDGVTFIVNGNVTITGSGGVFNSSNRPFAVISTGTITFSDALTQANGLFVGATIAFGGGANPLKIVGNVSASSSTFTRDRLSSAASMFIVFDPIHYMSIVDKVSTVKSSWTELQ